MFLELPGGSGSLAPDKIAEGGSGEGGSGEGSSGEGDSREESENEIELDPQRARCTGSVEDKLPGATTDCP